MVRLHDGDPCLYSALNEQICALADADINVEVVPGISAYQATAAAINAELTIPGVVQTIVLGRAGAPAFLSANSWIIWPDCRHHYACLSARHVDEVQSTLLKHYPADTPVAIGYRVSWLSSSMWFPSEPWPTQHVQGT